MSSIENDLNEIKPIQRIIHLKEDNAITTEDKPIKPSIENKTKGANIQEIGNKLMTKIVTKQSMKGPIKVITIGRSNNVQSIPYQNCQVSTSLNTMQNESIRNDGFSNSNHKIQIITKHMNTINNGIIPITTPIIKEFRTNNYNINTDITNNVKMKNIKVFSNSSPQTYPGISMGNIASHAPFKKTKLSFDEPKITHNSQKPTIMKKYLSNGHLSCPKLKTNDSKKFHGSEKICKGLRHFSRKVCEKVQQKGTTTYNEVADELISELNEFAGFSPDPGCEYKNIRRRVYDALNVLMAMNIITKEKKEIKWVGLPTTSLQECASLENECRVRYERILSRRSKLRELIIQHVALKNLIKRNADEESKNGPPLQSTTVKLPFICLSTEKSTIIDCSISNDKTEYIFKFNQNFQVHDDVEILRQMGLAKGMDFELDSKDEDIKNILNMMPPSMSDFIKGSDLFDSTPLMFKNTFQSGFLSILYSIGNKPLQIWEKKVRNGHIKRITDNDIQSLVLEIVGSNVSTTYITCPNDPKKTLGIKLPFLVMIIKNMKKYFTFEVQVVDDKNVRRRFRASNYQSTTRVKPFICTMPMRLDDGWNQIQFNLSDFTRRAYGTNYIETLKVQIHANCRIRRVYFSDRLYSEEELPPEFKLYLPVQKGQQV
ncbi:Cilia- and flagella-associated protein 20 [Intoshia linei]|uniref:Cilia-and flagella-associated protein 20 n=1 Tax=Intoshia linei TaxID=1819745 RepID=A0A177B245_9BILA|nr:Cilia- and flagella-associated protein 20 [Intoshia linei]